MKKTPSFSLDNFDRSIRPQDDFFHHAGGGWLQKNPIPEEKAMWGTFYVLREEGTRKVHAILKEKVGRYPRGSASQQLGDFYRSGMDMKTRNARGLSPLEPRLSRIRNIHSTHELFSYIFESHRAGDSVLWRAYVGQDDKNTDAYIFHLGQGGLTLPDREYYLKQDTVSKKIRDEFILYAQSLFMSLGMSTSESLATAKRVLAFETSLARASMSRTDARVIEKVYNRLSLSKLMLLAPRVPWKKYLQALGITAKTKRIIVLQPNFFKALSVFSTSVPLATWKEYLLLDALSSAAPHLSQTFVDIDFNFNKRILAGIQKPEPRWKIVTKLVNEYLGHPVGKEYVKRYFPERAKREADEMVSHLFEAYRARIQKLSWMSSTTKRKALAKLNAMSRKIGYPEKWDSFRGLVINSADYYGNIERAAAFLTRKNLAKLGKKVDRREWFSSPQTVNAFYDPNNNEIVFPAGILQPPFFDPDGDDAINYGAMGAVIGHELTHGFDDEGSKFDARGNYRNWWSVKDRARFMKRARVLVHQFNAYRLHGIPVNGKLTLGENIADVGGVVIAYDAYQKHLHKHGRSIRLGYTPEQRFFFGLALFEISHAREALARMLLTVDPHSPSQFRVNGPVSNVESFYEAFQVTEGDALYRKKKDRADLW